MSLPIRRSSCCQWNGKSAVWWCLVGCIFVAFGYLWSWTNLSPSRSTFLHRTELDKSKTGGRIDKCTTQQLWQGPTATTTQPHSMLESGGGNSNFSRQKIFQPENKNPAILKLGTLAKHPRLQQLLLARRKTTCSLTRYDNSSVFERRGSKNLDCYNIQNPH